MPVIRVNAPPLTLDSDFPAALKSLSNQIANFTEIDEKHFTILWHTYEKSKLISGGKTIAESTQVAPTVLVDCLIPDQHNTEARAKLLEACSTGITKVFGISHEQIFVHIRLATSGTVFDSGHVVTW